MFLAPCVLVVLGAVRWVDRRTDWSKLLLGIKYHRNEKFEIKIPKKNNIQKNQKQT